jgi:hypothetical protein
MQCETAEKNSTSIFERKEIIGRRKDGQNNFISGSHRGKGNEEDQISHGGKK